MNQPLPDAASTPWANSAYSIKRHGSSLSTCDSEPVQTPGCIQDHGALLVLRLEDLTILQVSENSAHFFGEPPATLLGQPVARVVGEERQARLRNMLQHESLERSVLYAFTLPERDQVAALDVSVHTLGGVAILEFEATERLTPHAERDFFSLVKSAVGHLQTAIGLNDFCNLVATEVRGLTGLDRVMVYRFHADDHGEVFAESKRDDLPGWLGLHYPATDIPQPARDIFKKLWIRPLQNAAGPLVELVPLANPDTGEPLDMTHCALRGASVMYTEYLANMGVAATLVMPIVVDGKLWGLVVCHQYTPTHFPYQMRAACELMAQVVSLQLKSTEYIEQQAYRLKVENVHQQLIAKAAQDGDLMALFNSQPNVLDAMQADGAALFHLGRWWCVGSTPTDVQLDALAEWLNQRAEFDSSMQPVYATDALARDYPAGADIAAVASGVLAVRVSRLQQDLIIWFRPETMQTVNWAGDPHHKIMATGAHGARLTPRGSFELFVESVRERALPWTAMEVDAALHLRLLVMELVVSRAERLAELNIDLTTSNEELDAFAYVASHDLKEPLRGIHRYAHQIMASAQALEPENQQRIESLMRLTLRMDALLDSLLHFSRVGRTLLEFEAVDLNQVLADALEMVGVRQGEDTCAIELARPLPMVYCNEVRVREIFSNLISNALKYSHQARPRIDIGYLMPGEPGQIPNAPPEASGQTVYYVRDDGIGIEHRHFEQIFQMFKRLHGRNDFGGGVGAGLTVVKKVVSRHGGQIWLDSTPGVGSTFYFTLPDGARARP
ncbi:MAG: multi-sensor signal transduction histidine kinase [Polaromonas sp.]|nr:multi-sensor signal transduction histidine kinase [Polaromonas sp.]